MKGKRPLVTTNSWENLRGFTRARIALGHAGESLATRDFLQLQRDHALARDAVHHELDFALLARALAKTRETILVRTRADTRLTYLRRPDFGRTLASESAALVRERKSETPEILLVVGDGLSGIGIERHAPELTRLLAERLGEKLFSTVVLVKNARVAVADEIATLWNAELVIHLLGERPGLSSPESIGAYITYRPRVGTTDESRNCVSNIYPGGLDLKRAADKIAYLAGRALAEKASGLLLKDEETLALPNS